MVICIRIKPEDKRKKLKQLLSKKKLLRVLEVHNGISALVASNISVQTNIANHVLEFDAMWASSLTDATSKGLPDIELISLDSRLDTIEQITSVSHKPLIVDGDTGRDIDSLEYFITKLETLGVSAVVFEDKIFPKRNSLDSDSLQNLEDPDIFANKIKAGKAASLSKDFMIFARIESLIAGSTVEDALFRARKYLQAGVDGILIHSRERVPTNLMRFASGYEALCQELGYRKPLICIPTTYNTIKEKELQKNGFNIVIYANHSMRASVKSMEEVSKLILLNGRAFETEPYCASVDKIFNMTGFSKIRQRDIEQSRAKVIILAAGKPKEEILKDMPTAMLDINGKTILQRQIDVLAKFGITDISVVRGYEKSKINANRVKYFDVDETKHGSLFSLLVAREEMKNGFIVIFSDIVFDESIIGNLLRNQEDITVVVDASYPIHKHEIDKELDLVISTQKDRFYREPSSIIGTQVSFIGKKIKKDIATHEFIGIAKFSAYGAQNLISVYDECARAVNSKFHESVNFERASIVDMLQEMIDAGFRVNQIETNKGWMEIHNKRDYEMLKRMVPGCVNSLVTLP